MTVTTALAQAARLHAAGKYSDALRSAEEALAANPRDLGALRLVGLLYCQTGEPALGAGFLTQAVSQAPKDLPTRLNAIQALLQSGKAAEAEKLAASAPPTASADLLKLRAAAAAQLGNHDRRVDLLKQALALDEQDYGGWNNLGNALHDAGRYDEAVTALEKARDLKPGDEVVLGNLARSMAATGRAGDGIAALAAIVKASPNDAKAHWRLAEALREAGDNGGAIQVIGRAGQLDNRDPFIFTTMGVIFGNLNDLAKAEQAFRYAVSVDPRHAPAYLNLGILLEQGNRLDDLKVLIRQMADQGLRGDETRFLAALLLRRDGKLADALEIASSTEPGGSIDDNMRAHLIGQLADRLDQPQLAFDSFVAMHEASAQSPTGRRFDGSEVRREIDKAREKVTRPWYGSWQVPPSAMAGRSPAAPAFLVGFLRSGTTLLDTMLMGHPGTHVMEEEPILTKLTQQLDSVESIGALDEQAIAALRDSYFREADSVAPVPDGALLVDKNPLASLRAPLIHRLFPDARFIFALRHPCDVVLSCFMQNFKINQAMASFLTLDNAARYYDSVMHFWANAREVMPLNVHTIRYEDLVADREPELRRLVDFLGLTWDDQLLEHEDTAAKRGYIRTPSYAQVTEGIYQRASGRWEKYREQLAPVLPILAPWAEAFGYDPIEL
ncbi:tetratricopeptide repeat-containing sulfotransferase family protein [Sphingomonas xanthus]|uniref:Tetratricopeptide repeat protein n=1 Tax=Sphingomonas xanthus TaxID=2594473 RepID=A0A516IS48_9SPHN|nr:tetratricopeptide repeat-containing sulfotransferase family protein [Sphingomonas xanthus]QDP19747.1 tetratricopeptide repeat protein [Sphingomonas xanthus]